MKRSLRTPFKPCCAAHIPLRDSLPGTWDSSPPNSNIRQPVLEIQTASEVRPVIPVPFSLAAPAGTLRDRNSKLYETTARCCVVLTVAQGRREGATLLR